MKLPIRKKWFDKIKRGEKLEEFRDAHFTLQCIETGETLVVDVTQSEVQSSADTKAMLAPISKQEFKSMFSDNRQLRFKLRLR